MLDIILIPSFFILINLYEKKDSIITLFFLYYKIITKCCNITKLLLNNCVDYFFRSNFSFSNPILLVRFHHPFLKLA
jgi:hypothetical protein